MIKEKRTASMACPSAWWLWLENEHLVFVNYRFGKLSIRVSKFPSQLCIDAQCGIEIYYKQLGKLSSGFMSWDDAEPIVIEELKKYFKI